jgi:hypothetical protein
VVAFLGGHRPQDGQLLAVLGQLGQVLAEFHSRRSGGDLLEGSAVGMAGLEVEGVRLAGAAIHPQQDARPLALRAGGRGRRQPLEPAGHRQAGEAGRTETQPIAPRQVGKRIAL